MKAEIAAPSPQRLSVAGFKKQSQVKEIWRRFRKNKLAMLGLAVIAVLTAIAILASAIVPYKVAITMNMAEKLKSPSKAHLFGTDGYGRDLFARCIHGAAISMLIGFSTSLFSLVFGTIIGTSVGYYGGKVDQIVMRLLDIVSALPTILLALTIIAALGSSIINLIIALTISRVPGFVRIVRSSVMGISDQEFIEAARAGGASDIRIMWKHILPNVMGPLIVQATMNVAQMILMAASMSFLGLGVIPPQPEWGAIISEAREFMRTSAYMMVFPGLFIIVSSLAINLMGDGLRDALDPRLKS